MWGLTIAFLSILLPFLDSCRREVWQTQFVQVGADQKNSMQAVMDGRIVFSIAHVGKTQEPVTRVVMNQVVCHTYLDTYRQQKEEKKASDFPVECRNGVRRIGRTRSTVNNGREPVAHPT